MKQQRAGWIDAEGASQGARQCCALVAYDPDGVALVRSAVLHAPRMRVDRDAQARDALRRLIADLARMGWEAVPTGRLWYAHKLRYVGPANVTRSEPRRRAYPPVPHHVMWGMCGTLLVLLLGAVLILGISAAV